MSNEKKITVFSTKGKKRFSVNSTADTWGELKVQLLAEGVETQGLRSIIGETQLTLESSKAILPDYDFTLFLSPVKVKSGCDVDPFAMSYKECKEFIKEEIAGDPKAKAFFGNYTIMSTGQMQKLIFDYLNANSELVTEDAAPVDVVELIDAAIHNLEVLRNKVVEGVVQKDDTSKLEAWFKDIEKNLA